MELYHQFDNGLKLVANKIEGLMSVSVGVLVKTGSANESEQENGISHFIEHTVFKGTTNRSAFDISDGIDKIGAQINAFTSKELTCFYTKSTSDHLEESMDVLSDILFNATFDEEELKKEKGVIIEEINMSEDTPEDICLDLLAESYYGKEGLGRTILGSAENVKRFTVKDVRKYMDKYYTADNIVISVAGNIDPDKTLEAVKRYFADKFTAKKSAPQVPFTGNRKGNLFRVKDIEQAHVAFSLPSVSMVDDRADAIGIANLVLGGGMSSRLFQKIREELGLCYTVYSYPSQYKDSGVIEIYGGVNSSSRDLSATAIIEEINKFKKSGITNAEFNRGKEQLKSSLVFGRENTATQMLLYGKYLLFLNKRFDFAQKIKEIENITEKDVADVINEFFDTDLMASATVGTENSPLKI